MPKQKGEPLSLPPWTATSPHCPHQGTTTVVLQEHSLFNHQQDSFKNVAHKFITKSATGVQCRSLGSLRAWAGGGPETVRVELLFRVEILMSRETVTAEVRCFFTPRLKDSPRTTEITEP